MEVFAGALFGLAVIGLGYLTRQGTTRSFYSTVLIVIALVYVLFAVMTGTLDVVLTESIIAVGFIALAVVGARWPRPRWAGGLIAGALVLHGGFDLVHDALIHNPAVPPWWPVFCAVVDVVIGAWLVGVVTAQHATSASPSRPVREASVPASCGIASDWN